MEAQEQQTEIWEGEGLPDQAEMVVMAAQREAVQVAQKVARAGEALAHLLHMPVVLAQQALLILAAQAEIVA